MKLQRSSVCMIVLSFVMMALAASTAPANEKLYEDVQVLQVARHLQLTAEQTTEISKLATEHRQRARQLTRDMDALHEESAENVEAVLKAWRAGQLPADDVRRAGDEAANDYNRLVNAYDSDVADMIERARAMLESEQLERIETSEETEQRLEELRFWEDTQATYGYLVEQVEIARALTPAEYTAIRALVAQETAEFVATLLGFGRSDTEQLVRPLLSIFDAARNWSRAEFADRRETLGADICQYLGIELMPPPPVSNKISRDQFRTIVTCERSANLLSKLKTDAPVSVPDDLPFLGGCDLEGDAVSGHTMTDLIHKAQYLTALNDLSVTPSQLSAMVPVARGLSKDYSQQRGDLLKTVTENAKTLRSLQATLQDGGTVGGSAADTVRAIYEAESRYEQNRMRAAVQHLWSVHEILDPRQNRLIDWRAPGPLGPAIPKEERLQRLTGIAGNVRNMVNMLDETRYIDPTTYEFYADREATEFLRQFIPERSPNFERRRNFLVNMQMQARGIAEDEWDEVTASQLAVRTMRGLGLLPPGGGPGMGVTGGPDAPYDWWDMEAIFSDEQTPQILRDMLALRAGQ
ncbi:MAG: hypothetical protein ACLFWB_06165 [Armatimonadota bacterium]